MCLAIPAQITAIENERMATIDILGVVKQASIDLVPEAKVGSWILVHAGFGIEIISEEDARETIELVKQMPVLIEDDPELIEAARRGTTLTSDAATSTGAAPLVADAR